MRSLIYFKCSVIKIDKNEDDRQAKLTQLILVNINYFYKYLLLTLLRKL